MESVQIGYVPAIEAATADCAACGGLVAVLVWADGQRPFVQECQECGAVIKAERHADWPAGYAETDVLTLRQQERLWTGLDTLTENTEDVIVTSHLLTNKNAPDTFTPATFTPKSLPFTRHGSYDEDADSIQTVFSVGNVRRSWDGHSEINVCGDTVYMDAELRPGTSVLLSGVLKLTFGRNRLAFSSYSTAFLRDLHSNVTDGNEELPY